ncbi:MAG: DUF4337 domain-containing protein [Pseudomonadota bacterium]
MSNEEKEPWLNYLALTTIIFAVGATLSTFKGGGFSTKSVINQAQASDQWAFFQAKSIRETMYRIQKDKLSLEKSLLQGANNQDTVKRYDEAIKQAEQNINKYEKQKNEIQTEAKVFEKKRDDAQRQGQPFGLAVIFFQVAILLSSVSGLFNSKWLWYAAIPLGAIGIFYFVDGFLLFL